MIAIEVRRRTDGKVTLQSVSSMRITQGMVNSRRRMRVYAKRVRRELEARFVGITFDRFEVVFTRHRARLHITPSVEGFRLVEELIKE